MTRIAILFLALVLAGSSGAQTPASSRSNPNDPDIVVQHRTDDAIARLVKSLTATQRGAQVSRWNTTICPRVLGLQDPQAVLILDRIGAVARMLGVAVVTKGCQPSLTIVVTDQADRVAKLLVDEHPGLFGDPTYGVRHGMELEELRQPRPVLWLDATRTGGADGRNSSDLIPNYGGGSRIRALTRENVMLSLVIVDAERLSHITWGQLADYLALVTLARPQLTAAPSDSVLSIFAARDAGTRGPPGLTPTDLTFLQGLYRSDASLGAAAQRAQIADRVRKGSKP